MPRTTYANEGLLDYLISLAKPRGFTIGLILGQSCAQKDFVIHLARTSPPSKKDVIEESVISGNSILNDPQDSVDNTYILSIKDIPGSWVADHAKHVTRMLPGGMWVLGIFTVGPEDIFHSNACVEKLKAILAAVHKNVASNQYLYGNHKQENLLLNFNSITQKYASKSLDTTNGNNGGILRPVDWKFQSSAVFTKWHQLETLVDFDRLFPIVKSKTPISLKKQLQDILKETSNIINSALVIIEGELRCLDDAVETIGKQQQMTKDKKICCDKEISNDVESEEKILQVGLYIPCQKTFSVQTNTISSSASMRLVGQLISRTFVHQRATIEEAVKAVKQDVMRSLASRLEMHWDSLIEEEDGCPEETVTLHEPPRRVLVQLPRNKVTLSDYLFPGEGAQEALFSLRELLDIQQVQEGHIQKDLELQVDPSEFYCQNANIRTTAIDLSSHQKYVKGKKRILIFITGLSFAFFIVIIAIIFHRT